MNKSLYTLLLTLLAFSAAVNAQSVITVTDADLTATSDVTWTSDNIYLLDGFVFLEAGGRLNIEAGTIIKGKDTPSSNDLASSLIIARGAQIFAVGTENNPIIFTAEIDNTNDPFDMLPTDRGLWGGLIILGNASITDETTEEVVEGLPADDNRSLYGGDNDNDNSGMLQYVSIRHGGAELAPGEEINGLTLGGIGSGTDISYVEVIANSDDGIELFGGTVDIRFATVAFCGDDSYDFDTGWRGNGQFWFSLQATDDGDNAAEMDGAKPDANTPSTNPTIYNATFIGSGPGASAKNEHALLFRDGMRGRFYNSIFTEFDNYGIQVEDRASGIDSYGYLQAGELVIANNIFWSFGNGDEFAAGEIIQVTEDAEETDASSLVTHLLDNNNVTLNPQLGNVVREDANEDLDPRPSSAGPAYDNLAAYPDNDFFEAVSYKGAFPAEGAWIVGWTALDEMGLLDPSIDFVNNLESPVAGAGGFRLLQSMPNPAFARTSLQFELPAATTLSLLVFDNTGREVARLINNEYRPAGLHTVEFNTARLPQGTYVYTLISGATTVSKQLIIAR